VPLVRGGLVIQLQKLYDDAVLRWSHEQGLSKRRMTEVDVFAPELLDT
jgi:hypothetical protein